MILYGQRAFQSDGASFSAIFFQMKFEEKHPECDCEHIKELAFLKDFYENCMLKKICPSCDKFMGSGKLI